MLQPIPARPLFRVLELPLGAIAIATALRALFSIGGFGDLIVGPMVLFACLVILLFGVLGVIHSLTGCLPQWVAGRGDDSADDDAHAA